RAAAKRLIVHRFMRVGGEIANVGQVVLDQSLFRRPLGDTRSQYRREHLGEKGQDINSQRHSSRFDIPSTPFSRPACGARPKTNGQPTKYRLSVKFFFYFGASAVAAAVAVAGSFFF